MKKPLIPIKFSKVSLIVLILGLGIGLLASAQWKTKPTRVTNPVIPYVSLEETRVSLAAEQESFKKQIKDLQEKISQDQTQLKKQPASRAKAEELERYRQQIGLTEAKGKGVLITIDDSQTSSAEIGAITHAADLRDLINFLWGMGAETISVNGERIVFLTSIDCIVNTILINDTRTVPPFIIQAIGDPSLLASALANENNLKDIHGRVKKEGLIFKIEEQNDLLIPAYDGSFRLEYATIVS